MKEEEAEEEEETRNGIEGFTYKRTIPVVIRQREGGKKL